MGNIPSGHPWPAGGGARSRSEEATVSAAGSGPSSVSCVSSFQKTVLLHDWWLIKSRDEGNRESLAVAGMTSAGKAARVFKSAPIVKRYDIYTVETKDGITVRILGLINESRMDYNEFPLEACSHFRLGFPYNWKAYADLYCVANTEGNDSLRTCTNEDSSAKILECLKALCEECISRRGGRNDGPQKESNSMFPPEKDKNNDDGENVESTCNGSTKSTSDPTNLLVNDKVPPAMPAEFDPLLGTSHLHDSSSSMKLDEPQIPASPEKGNRPEESNSDEFTALDPLVQKVNAFPKKSSNGSPVERSRCSHTRSSQRVRLQKKRSISESSFRKEAAQPIKETNRVRIDAEKSSVEKLTTAPVRRSTRKQLLFQEEQVPNKKPSSLAASFKGLLPEASNINGDVDISPSLDTINITNMLEEPKSSRSKSSRTPAIPKLRVFFENKRMGDGQRNLRSKRKLEAVDVFSFTEGEEGISSIKAAKEKNHALMSEGCSSSKRQSAAMSASPRGKRPGLETAKSYSKTGKFVQLADEAKSASFASPELLNLKRSMSGRVIVPKLSNWCQQILYKDGSIAGIKSGFDAIAATHPRNQSAPSKKRKKSEP